MKTHTGASLIASRLPWWWIEFLPLVWLRFFFNTLHLSQAFSDVRARLVVIFSLEGLWRVCFNQMCMPKRKFLRFRTSKLTISL